MRKNRYLLTKQCNKCDRDLKRLSNTLGLVIVAMKHMAKSMNKLLDDNEIDYMDQRIESLMEQHRRDIEGI